MSSRLPRITGGELLRALERAGWERASQSGSHVKLRRPGQPGRVIVPIHSGETIPLGTLRSILTQAGLTVNELTELL